MIKNKNIYTQIKDATYAKNKIIMEYLIHFDTSMFSNVENYYRINSIVFDFSNDEVMNDLKDIYITLINELKKHSEIESELNRSLTNLYLKILI
jgi:hypothetical protein